MNDKLQKKEMALFFFYEGEFTEAVEGKFSLKSVEKSALRCPMLCPLWV